MCFCKCFRILGLRVWTCVTVSQHSTVSFLFTVLSTALRKVGRQAKDSEVQFQTTRGIGKQRAGLASRVYISPHATTIGADKIRIGFGGILQ